MRFISISEKIQLSCTVIILGILSWVGLTSYSYIFTNEILARKNLEVAEADQHYQKASEQFNVLKRDIEMAAKSLEQRQVYLQQLVDSDASLNSDTNEESLLPLPEKDHGGTEDKVPETKITPAYDKISRDQQRQDSLEELKSQLALIEKKQQQLANNMTSRISKRLAYIDKVMQLSGVKPEKIMQLADNRPSQNLAQGGPFILYSEELDIPLTASEPFAKLYSHHNRLIDLESAIQSVPVIKPVKKYYISSSFGVRKDPFKKTWARHYGLDMAGWRKTPIFATSEGMVTKAGWNGAYGKFIEIDHGNGFLSRYGHLSKLKVKKGQKVTIEQEIGLMGSTGRSTSPHLHYEIWFNGKSINPVKIFKAEEDVLKIQRQEYDS